MPREARWPPPVYTRRGKDYLRVRSGGTVREFCLGPVGSKKSVLERERLVKLLEEGHEEPEALRLVAARRQLDRLAPEDYARLMRLDRARAALAALSRMELELVRLEFFRGG